MNILQNGFFPSLIGLLFFSTPLIADPLHVRVHGDLAALEANCDDDLCEESILQFVPEGEQLTNEIAQQLEVCFDHDSWICDVNEIPEDDNLQIDFELVSVENSSFGVPIIEVHYASRCEMGFELLARFNDDISNYYLEIPITILNRPIRFSNVVLDNRQPVINEEISISFAVSDACIPENYTGFVRFGDESESEDPQDWSSNNGELELTHAYNEPGAYTIQLSARDPSNNELIVTYEDVIVVSETESPDTLDTDQDGILDSIERGFGLNPYDPSDADLDHDGDGISTGDEIANNTAPFYPNTPLSPALTSPTNRQRFDSLPITLRASTTDPDNDEIEMLFAIYNDQELQYPIFSQRVLAQNGLAEITISSELTEGSRYYWHAKGCDPAECGNWSSTRQFDLNLPQTPPLTPIPVRPFGVVNELSAQFVWFATEELGGETFTYELQVQNNGETIYQIADLEMNTTRHDVADLFENNGEYAWSIRATDEINLHSSWSDPLAILVRLANSAPSAPTFISPDGVTVAGREQHFLIENGSDPDGDSLWVEAEFALQGNFLNATNVLIPANENGVTEIVHSFNAPAESLRWRARMSDGADVSNWINASFGLRLTNSAPNTPNVIEPLDGIEVTTKTPTFAFTINEDPEGDEISLSLEIAQDAAFQEIIARQNRILVEDGSATITLVEALEDQQRYYWRATAQDDWGAVSNPTAVASFDVHVANTPPQTPVTIRPFVGDNFDEGVTVVLEIANTTDSENDDLSYVFEIFDDAELSANNLVVSTYPIPEGIRATRYTITRLIARNILVASLCNGRFQPQ